MAFLCPGRVFDPIVFEHTHGVDEGVARRLVPNRRSAALLTKFSGRRNGMGRKGTGEAHAVNCKGLRPLDSSSTMPRKKWMKGGFFRERYE